MKIRAVEMNDYDEEALVARSRCNHTLGRNEAAIEDGELQVLFILNNCALSVLYFEQLCFVIIGPESDHWECLSVTHSLTH